MFNWEKKSLLEYHWISFLPKDSNNILPVLVQVMAWEIMTAIFINAYLRHQVCLNQ